MEWDEEGILSHHTLSNDDLLKLVSAYRPPVIDQRLVSVRISFAIEWIVGYGLTVGSETFDTCRWVGRFEQAAGGATLVTRKAIKLHLCGNTQAKDQHIRQALIDRIGEPGTKKHPGPTYGIVGHEWAALAVAITYWDQRRPT